MNQVSRVKSPQTTARSSPRRGKESCTAFENPIILESDAETGSLKPKERDTVNVTEIDPNSDPDPLSPPLSKKRMNSSPSAPSPEDPPRVINLRNRSRSKVDLVSSLPSPVSLLQSSPSPSPSTRLGESYTSLDPSSPTHSPCLSGVKRRVYSSSSRKMSSPLSKSQSEPVLPTLNEARPKMKSRNQTTSSVPERERRLRKSSAHTAVEPELGGGGSDDSNSDSSWKPTGEPKPEIGTSRRHEGHKGRSPSSTSSKSKTRHSNKYPGRENSLGLDSDPGYGTDLDSFDPDSSDVPGSKTPEGEDEIPFNQANTSEAPENNSPRTIDNKIRRLIRTSLPEGQTKKLKDNTIGCVYIVKNKSLADGIWKIGMTEGTTEQRRKQIARQCGVKVESNKEGDEIKVAERVEKLCHAQLNRFNWPHHCHKCLNKKGDPTQHKEYFQLDAGIAIEYIKLWTSFGKTLPYGSDGKLKRLWEKRLHAHPQCPHDEAHDAHEVRIAHWQSFIQLGFIDLVERDLSAASVFVEECNESAPFWRSLFFFSFTLLCCNLDKGLWLRRVVHSCGIVIFSAILYLVFSATKPKPTS